jgi:DNA-binding XRE family transcriptional regulator
LGLTVGEEPMSELTKIASITDQIKTLELQLQNEKKSLLERIGERIKKIRKDAGLTQIELAKMTGVNRTVITNIEVGNSIITLENLIVICDRLKVSSDWILGLDPNSQ